jgi:hypothetical protein
VEIYFDSALNFCYATNITLVDSFAIPHSSGSVEVENEGPGTVILQIVLQFNERTLYTVYADVPLPCIRMKWLQNFYLLEKSGPRKSETLEEVR